MANLFQWSMTYGVIQIFHKTLTFSINNLDISVAALGFQIHGFPKIFFSNGRGVSMISKLKRVKMFLFLPIFRDIYALKFFFIVFA